MPEDQVDTPEDAPKPEGEIVVSFRLLGGALRTPAGLAGLAAAILLPVVTYAYYRPMELGIVGYEWRHFPWIGVNIVCLLVVPLLVIKLGLREKISDYGMTLGDWRLWGKHAIVYLVVVLPVIAIASRQETFKLYYPMCGLARSGVGYLLLWELAYGAYFFAWEFFFRGFLLQGIAKRLGPAAIALQTLPFVMMHLGKPEPELYASIIAGLALGVTAYRSRSFVGCWLVHWICAGSMDILALL